MADDSKKGYDQRQYRLMAGQLQRVAEGKLGLVALIGNLKSLLSVLEATDEAWKDDFRREWGALEIAYAVILDRNEQGLETDVQMAINDLVNRPDVKTALQNVRRLVEERIDATAGIETDAEVGGEKNGDAAALSQTS